MQEAHLHVKRGWVDLLMEPAHQALCLHGPGVRAALLLAERLRVDAPKGPTLPVLHRGWPVRVQDIALVEDCVDYVFSRREVHGATSASTPSRRVSRGC